MIFKFERANRMGNALGRIGLAVGKVIRGIDTPFISGTMMFGVKNTVHHGITHIQIPGSHVNFGA